VAELSEDAA